jgi:hypothetical protein
MKMNLSIATATRGNKTALRTVRVIYRAFSAKMPGRSLREQRNNPCILRENSGLPRHFIPRKDGAPN